MEVGPLNAKQPPSPAVPRSRGGGFLASEPLLLIGLIILTLYFARTLIVPLAFAVVLNFLLAPAVERLECWHFRRAPAVVLVILIFFTALSGVGWVVARQLVRVAELLPDYRENIQAKLDRLHAPASGAAGHALSSLEDLSRELTVRRNPSLTPVVPLDSAARERKRQRTAVSRQGQPSSPAEPMPVQVIEPPMSPSGYLKTLVAPILKPVGEAFVVMIFTVYLLMNREDLRNRLLLLAGIGRLNLMSQALSDAGSRISIYLVWQFVVNVSYGCLAGLGLFLLGVPDATLWGALAAILRYVPYVGPVAGGLLPLLFSLAIFPSWYPALFVFGIFFVLELATSNFFEPWLYGSQTGISALALLASAIFWSMMWGGAGLVLATPLTVCLIVMGRYVPHMRFLHVLLGEEAVLAPEAKFYDRLLAMDQVEAHAIVDKYLEEKSVVELYDRVLLPALAMAENDRHRGRLEDARSDYIVLSMAELLAELSEYKADAAERTGVVPPLDAPAPSSRRSPIVCIPAEDQADELTTTMLAQLLEAGGYDTLLLPTASVTPEILERLAQEPSTIVCISALPPFAFTHARDLCHKLRERLRDQRILVGLWLSQPEPDLTLQRFGQHGPDTVVVRLNDALLQIEAWQNGTRAKPAELPVVAPSTVPVNV